MTAGDVPPTTPRGADPGGAGGRPPAGWGGPRTGRGDGPHLWPPLAAVVVAAVVYGLMPDGLLVVQRFVVPVLEVALGLALLVMRRRGSDRVARVSRWMSVALAALVIGTNLVALYLLVASMDSDASGSDMLVGAMQVWVTNTIGFALLYWEIDRGGPMARERLPRERLPLADWRFSQDENDDAVAEVGEGSSEATGWTPRFVDYAYLSLTNSSAFSPTDTMPLSPRAKVLMGLQATAALFTSLLVVARAVGSMGQ